jgi:hypothetical protein
VTWAAGRPFAWVDDEITDADRDWVSAHHGGRALLHRVESFRGSPTKTSQPSINGSELCEPPDDVFAMKSFLPRYQGTAPSSLKKPPLGPSSGSVASSTTTRAPSSTVRVPWWPFRSVAT